MYQLTCIDFSFPSTVVVVNAKANKMQMNEICRERKKKRKNANESGPLPEKYRKEMMVEWIGKARSMYQVSMSELQAREDRYRNTGGRF